MEETKRRREEVVVTGHRCLTNTEIRNEIGNKTRAMGVNSRAERIKTGRDHIQIKRTTITTQMSLQYMFHNILGRLNSNIDSCLIGPLVNTCWKWTVYNIHTSSINGRYLFCLLRGMLPMLWSIFPRCIGDPLFQRMPVRQVLLAMEVDEWEGHLCHRKHSSTSRNRHG